MERIYDDAKDKNVAAVIVYTKKVSSTSYAYKDAAKTEALTSKELEDAFVKGCLVADEDDGEIVAWTKPTAIVRSLLGDPAFIVVNNLQGGDPTKEIYATDPEVELA